MGKTILALVLISLLSISNAQDKYYIFFTDKGDSGILSKKMETRVLLEKEYNPKALERRIKTMGEVFTFEDYPIYEEYKKYLSANNIKIENELRWFNAVTAFLTTGQIELLKSASFVKSVEKVKILKKNYPEIDNQNALMKMIYSSSGIDYGLSLTQAQLSDVPAVHDMGFNGQKVRLGLLDTGFKWRGNNGLEDRNIIAEYDFVEKDDVTENQAGKNSSQHNHGTAVFSLCGAYLPGTIVGPAYGAEFLLGKTEDTGSEKNIEEDNYIAAIEWMEKLGVDIISSSLGYTTFDSGQLSYTYADMNGKTAKISLAVDKAFQRGVLMITAAGNDGNNSWKYISAPGDAFNVLTIGAVDNLNKKGIFSSVGPTSDGRIKPELVTMGVSNTYLTPSGYISQGNGTSYATPIAAGIAAQLYSAFPHLSNVQARHILVNSGDKRTSPDNEKGYGLLSALKAVTFPNIEKVGNTYIVHKIFSNKNDVLPDKVKLWYREFNRGDMKSIELNTTDNLKFNGALTSLYNFTECYFEYFDKSGIRYKEPEDEFFVIKKSDLNFYFSKMIISIDPVDGDTDIEQNFPNPFSKSTKIRFNLAENSNVKITIYDSLGRLVKILVDNYLVKDKYEYDFSTVNSNVASGVYFYTIQTNSKTITKKMVLIK